MPASPNEVFTQMVTSTLRNRSNKVTDAVTKHNALYRRLKSKGRITMDGGREIVMPIDYDNGSTNYKRFSGYQPVPIDAIDHLTAAKYDWVQASTAVTASGREIRMNSGKNGLIKLVRSKVKHAQRDAANNQSIDIYSSGSLANQMGGLAHIIQTDGLGTVGGINASDYVWWRNKVREIVDTDGTGATPSTANIRHNMNALDMLCTRGTDRVDLIVSSHDLWQVYWSSLDDLQRYAAEGGAGKTAGSNFQELKFKSADVIFDDNSNFSTTAEKMYFINTDYLQLVEHEQGKWGEESKRVSVNQDAEVILMFWMGQMTCSSRERQGILIDEAA